MRHLITILINIFLACEKAKKKKEVSLTLLDQALFKFILNLNLFDFDIQKKFYFNISKEKYVKFNSLKIKIKLVFFKKKILILEKIISMFINLSRLSYLDHYVLILLIL